MIPRAISVVLALAGCSSQYFPQSRGHVSTTIKDGTFVYVRDGRSYDQGMFGGGLVDAVAGNAPAIAAATEYNDRLKTGFAATVVGLAGFVGGMGWTLDDAMNDHNSNAPLLFSVGSLVFALAGVLYAVTGETYRWDAINLFNDTADQTLPRN